MIIFFSKEKKHAFTCYNCNVYVVATKTYGTGIKANDYNDEIEKVFYCSFFCTNCGFINVFHAGIDDLEGLVIFDQCFSPKKYKKIIPNLDQSLKRIYEQILLIANNEMWETVILLTRIIIMHIAIEQGAEKNLSFYKYISFLTNKQILNKKLVSLLDESRELANSLNHEVKKFNNSKIKENQEKGKICINITIDVLENLYKYDHLIKK